MKIAVHDVAELFAIAPTVDWETHRALLMHSFNFFAINFQIS
jgi:hypothetical protein